MKKKLLLLLLSSMLLLSSCGSKQPSNTSTEPSNTTGTETNGSDMDSADQKEEDITLTIPAEYIGEQTQEDLDQLAQKYDFESITLNDDGSATYTMTNVQHQKFLDEYKQQIMNSIDEMIASESYPNFTNIETNDNFTEFTITTKSTELDMAESMSVIAFYGYGGIYSIFSGETVDNISVTFINEETGDVISSSNSKDLQE